MKNLLLSIMALFLINANVMADDVCATLQHEDQMTAFYGENALKDAYTASKDGDIITLSNGSFNPCDTISKSIKIIGAYGFSTNTLLSTRISKLYINANDVSLEGIYIPENLYLGKINNFIIRKSYVYSLNCWDAHTNSVVDQCVIYTEYSIRDSKKMAIKNSIINRFGNSNSSSDLAYISNCIIYRWYESLYLYYTPYAIYKNNIMVVNNISGSNSNYNYNIPNRGEFYYNRFLCYNSTYNYQIQKFTVTTSYVTYPHEGNVGDEPFDSDSFAEMAKGFPSDNIPVSWAKITGEGVGMDGTSRGPSGGSGFSEYPSIPRIIEKEISSHTNDEGKISVKLTVKAE